MTSNDYVMLHAVLTEAEQFDDERAESFESTRQAFADMLRRGRDLTDKQRAWLRGVYEDVCGVPTYANEWSAGKVPRGREVDTPAVLRDLPKRPPQRRSDP